MEVETPQSEAPEAAREDAAARAPRRAQIAAWEGAPHGSPTIRARALGGSRSCVLPSAEAPHLLQAGGSAWGAAGPPPIVSATRPASAPPLGAPPRSRWRSAATAVSEACSPCRWPSARTARMPAHDQLGPLLGQEVTGVGDRLDRDSAHSARTRTRRDRPAEQADSSPAMVNETKKACKCRPFSIAGAGFEQTSATASGACRIVEIRDLA